MSQSLKVNNLQVVVDATYKNTHDFGTDIAKIFHSWVLSLTNGTGSGSANFAWSDQITITASGSSTIDLSSLTDRFGNAIAPTIVKLLMVRLTSSSDTAASISLGGAASNAWTALLLNSSDLLKIRYQGFALFACKDATGYAVGGSDKNLKILNNSSTQSVVVDVAILGVK